MKQLPLGVRLQDRAVFAGFVAGPHPQPLAAVQQLARQMTPGMLYLHGAAGTGKSHLLQAMCAEVPGAGYFPLAALRALGPGVLEGAGGLPLVAIDDLAEVAGDPAWEQALFGLYNDRLQAGRLAVAAREPSTALPLSLPDLQSRLAAMPHYALRPLDEAAQREALKLRAALRGIDLPDDTLQYLQRRFARDMNSLNALLDRLDLASLQEQRRLTLPFIRAVLGERS